MPSSRLVFQIPQDVNPDQFMISPSEMKPQQPNNHHLKFTIRIDSLVLYILRNHPLRDALTAEAVVPELYVQQAWKTIRVSHMNENGVRVQIFKLEIDHFTSILTPERMRLTFNLPSETASEGITNYDDQFKKNNLPLFYYTLFSVINRCLTAKNFGSDNAISHILKLFYSVVHDFHIEYAQIFWTELYEKVVAKKSAKALNYIPYQRFMTLIVRCMLRSNRNIPTRINHPHAPVSEMRFLMRQKKAFSFSMSVPEALLDYADPECESVTSYRESMGRPEPVIPTPGSIYKKVESVRVSATEGVQKRGAKRKISERGSGGGKRTRLETSGSRVITPRIVTPVVNEGLESEQALDLAHDAQADNESESSEIPSATSSKDDDEETESDSIGGSTDDNDNNGDDAQDGNDFVVHIETSKSVDDTKVVEIADDESAKFVETQADILGDVDAFAPFYGTEAMEVEEQRQVDSILDAVVGEIRRTEGDKVENVEKKSESAPSHVLRTDAQDISSPLMHSHTHATHSISSQQEIVSCSHGDIAQRVPSSHSENQDIENREQLPRFSTSFCSQSSLVPFELPIVIPRLYFLTATIGSLRDPIGTTVVAPQSGLQGSVGSPVIDTSLPTMNTGHATDSSVVMQTINLSDTGITNPDFVSKEIFDGALKAVETRIMEKVEKEVGDLKRLLKGKNPVVEPEPAIPSQEIPNTQPADLFVDELKSLLLAKLLSQAPDSQHDADLLTFLQSHQQNQSP
ncbi:hypothetical protein L6452_31080 [Arctium lappa]|uniref:Uncharacterized protein n=1 Tax=Arctium lappa TaxID=4217 RepID=A0ACB8ZK57_ARCLA|nr:hypothetical protein L6452_31080 [Arctium lappa]